MTRLTRYLRRHRRALLLGLASGTLVVAGIVSVWAASLKIPDIRTIEERKVTQSTKIYDRTGDVLLMDLEENITRTVVPITDISIHIRNATVAIEDAEFYEHRGVKPTAILRAILTNISRGQLLGGQGGSTITQQVVKNSILTTDKTLTRKVKEWVLAIKLEQAFTKDKILELYLNESPYGGPIYGIEEASRTFFAKSARDITLQEAAYLAAIPQAPTYYSPYGNHLEALEVRKNIVLDRMLELDFITETEYTDAKNAVVTFAPQAVSGIRAPHFVFYVRELLEKEYGPRMLEESGWRIITTLDADLQGKAEEIVKRYALENEEKFNAENAALVAIDPKTGDILTMVGSRDYFDKSIEGAYNIAVANRQPGSAFKPFVYAQSFVEGYAPETVVFDVATQFSTFCGISDLSSEAPCYSPENYDNVYRGPVSLREALAQSINVPAVKTLYLVGIDDAIRLARSMGITTLEDRERYGLTLVLGGGEVKLIDLVSAYGVFANMGTKHKHRAILRIEDKDNNVVREYLQSPEKVLDENVALTVSDVLSDNVARTPAFGATSALYFPGRHVAAKTGTTNDYRDAWIVGYTPTVAVGAWAGNNDNSPMEKRVAGFIVAPMWHEFMEYALTRVPDEPFAEARPLTNPSDKPIIRGIWQGTDISRVNAITQAPVGPEFNGPTRERIAVSVHSILYSINKEDPRGPAPQNPADDPQFSRWEWAVRNWAERAGFTDGAVIFR